MTAEDKSKVVYISPQEVGKPIAILLDEHQYQRVHDQVMAAPEADRRKAATLLQAVNDAGAQVVDH